MQLQKRCCPVHARQLNHTVDSSHSYPIAIILGLGRNTMMCKLQEFGMDGAATINVEMAAGRYCTDSEPELLSFRTAIPCIDANQKAA
ncbi:MAG: hypothetical protein HHJ12_13300 [Glaciimonas sp.]|nr:hypothetical protein [Glaciimonas sp.]